MSEVLVRDGDQVTENQELLRLGGPAAAAQAAQAAQQNPQAAGRPPSICFFACTRRRPIIQATARAGAFASPQLGPLFRIAIDDEIELDAEVPYVHLLKLTPGVTARIPSTAARRSSGASHRRPGNRSPHAARQGAIGRAAKSGDQDRHVCARHHRRQPKLWRLGAEIGARSFDRTGHQGQHRRDAEGPGGPVSDTDIEIREGVKEGEIIVANAGTSLHDGDRVKTIFPDEFDRVRR